jgi:lipopolysaccharide biosynthesis regulator YciM
MSNWTPDEVKKAIEEIKTKSSFDHEFRALCFNDINKAVKQVADKEVPKEFKIDVIETKKGFDQTLVLPPMISSELSDDDLDQVTGGSKGAKDTKDQQSIYYELT